MPVYVIANPKGGVGKSTFSTNLAGYFASKGHKVMLGDIDNQQSSRSWLSLRPAHLPEISAWEIKEGNVAKVPKGITHVVLDTPAGLKGNKLDSVLKIADKLIIPLQASIFDMMANDDFLRKLGKSGERFDIGVVGMRVQRRSRSADQLQTYIEQLGLPMIGCLRDAQNYPQLASQGATIWDAPPSRVEKDIVLWQDILAWVERQK